MSNELVDKLEAELIAAGEHNQVLQADFIEALRLGDSPENFALGNALNCLEISHSRIAELKVKLERARQTDPAKLKVYEVMDDRGQCSHYSIAEDPIVLKTHVRFISAESPLGAALARAKAGMKVVFKLPNGGERVLTLLNVQVGVA